MSRFISEDPLPSPRNLYAYARNNPVRYVDPRGAAEIRAFGHTIAVFGSLTLGPINFQVDLEQVNMNLVVAPSFSLGVDFLIRRPPGCRDTSNRAASQIFRSAPDSFKSTWPGIWQVPPTAGGR